MSAASGRVRHDEKITVYLTPGELESLEAAVLTVRFTHGVMVDRGRFVRNAICNAVADLNKNGWASEAVQGIGDLP